MTGREVGVPSWSRSCAHLGGGPARPPLGGLGVAPLAAAPTLAPAPSGDCANAPGYPWRVEIIKSLFTLFGRRAYIP